MKPVVFFRGGKEPRLQHRGLERLGLALAAARPGQDLEPGYCDAFQLVAQSWDGRIMFIEFSKDHPPCHFRYALLPVPHYWNPKNIGWEEMPESDRPMIPVHKPPFARDKWTHVVFTFGSVNTGKKDGWGKLYVDGTLQGEFTCRENTFNWEAQQSAVTLGVSYVGFLDELALFDKPLTAAEVKLIHAAPHGLRALIK